MSSRSIEPLVVSLERLASAAESQEAYLVQLGVAPSNDELALEFDDAVGGVTVEGTLREKLQAVSERLKAMSGAQNSHLWQTDALRTAPEWGEVRRLAREALAAIRRRV
jgi:hypothetical protein